MMRKCLKYLWLSLLVIALLCAALIMAVVNFIHPNDYRQQISAYLTANIHQPVTIQGDIEWQFWPYLGVCIHQIQLGDQDNWQADIDQAAVSVQALPLFTRHLVIEAVDIDGVQGKILTNKGIGSVTVPSIAASPVITIATVSSYLPALEYVKVDHLQWLFQNHLTQTSSVLSQGQLTIKHLKQGMPVPFQLQGLYQIDSQKPALKIHGSGDGYFDSKHLACQSCQLALQITAKPILNIHFDSDYLINHHQAQILLQSQMLGLQTRATITASALNQDARIAFNWQGQSTDLVPLLQALLPAVQSNEKYYKNFHIKLQGNYDKGQLSLPGWQITLDNSQLQGSLTAALNTQLLHIEARLNQMDLAPYFNLPYSVIFKQLALQSKVIPSRDWRQWNINSNLAIQQVEMFHLPIEQITSNINMQQGQLQSQSQAQIFDGVYQGDTQVDFNVAPLAIQSQWQLHHLQLFKLWQHYYPSATVKLTGVAEVKGVMFYQQVLSSHFKIFIAKGSLQGIDIAYWLKTAEALLHHQSLAQASKNNRTEFKNFSADNDLQGDILKTLALSMHTDIADVKGFGRIDLVKHTIDYHFDIFPLHKAYRIPLVITGTLEQPQIQIDIAALSQNLLQTPKPVMEIFNQQQHQLTHWLKAMERRLQA